MLLFGVVDCLWMCSLSPAHHASGKWRLYNTMLQLCACCKYFFVKLMVKTNSKCGEMLHLKFIVRQTMVISIDLSIRWSRLCNAADRWPSVVARRHSNGHRLGYLFSKTVQELQSCKQNGARLASKGTWWRRLEKSKQYCLLIGDWCRNLLICISTYIFIHVFIYSSFSCWIARTCWGKSHN